MSLEKGGAIRMKLLLVDDDDAIRLVARTALRRAGFTVTVAAGGAEALEAIRADPPDVVLLDWMMPEVDGHEVCRRLKADASTSGIPVIFMTARSQRSDIANGLACGAAGYIVKPFDTLTLGDEVRALLAAK
jgi:DNA-binding response OmpR family regulator